MSFSVGITGLPNVGKSTLFNALTQNQVDVSNYPFCTIEPNVGVVEVPDQRLRQVAEVVQPEKITPTVIEFVDIAGLVKQAHQGEGLGNQFLAHIRECDAILEVVRVFPSDKIKHVQKEINPQRDIEIINTELIMKDLQTTKKALEKSDSQLLNKIKQALRRGKLVSELNLNQEQKQALKELQLLTQKPIIYLLNTDNGSEQVKANPQLTLNVKLEQEILELSEQQQQELKMESHLDKLITQCYNSLDLLTFYTITGPKTSAWTLKKGKTCPRAGGVVHSDFEEDFIKAQVINWKDLMEAGSWKEAKQRGSIRTTGKDYVVQDGDVIEFKI